MPRLLHLLLQFSVDSASLQPSHCLCLSLVWSRSLPLLNRKLELVEESEGCTSLLLHDVVGQLAVEADLEGAQSILDQVKVVHTGLLVRPIQHTATM